jgi:DnaJ-class molecular chaperone
VLFRSLNAGKPLFPFQLIGSLAAPNDVSSVCSDCKGEGKIIPETAKCRECKGNKFIKVTETINLNIRKGVKNNEII